MNVNVILNYAYPLKKCINSILISLKSSLIKIILIEYHRKRKHYHYSNRLNFVQTCNLKIIHFLSLSTALAGSGTRNAGTWTASAARPRRTTATRPHHRQLEVLAAAAEAAAKTPAVVKPTAAIPELRRTVTRPRVRLRRPNVEAATRASGFAKNRMVSC